MAPSPSPAAERAVAPAPTLEILLRLYAQEQRLYGEILELSRRQGDLLRAGAALGELRSLLTGKRDRLDAIARLEREHAPARERWELERSRGSGSTRLHAALRDVAGLIEQILEAEERNDQLLLAESGVPA